LLVELKSSLFPSENKKNIDLDLDSELKKLFGLKQTSSCLRLNFVELGGKHLSFESSEGIYMVLE